MKGWTGKLVPRTLEIHQKNMLFFWTMFKGCWQTFPCFRGRNLSFGAVSWIKCSCHSRILDTKKLDTKISIEFLHLVARNFFGGFFPILTGWRLLSIFHPETAPSKNGTARTVAWVVAWKSWGVMFVRSWKLYLDLRRWMERWMTVENERPQMRC